MHHFFISIKKLLVLFLLVGVLSSTYALRHPQTVSAAGCTSVGQCVNNKICICVSGCGSGAEQLVPGSVDCGSSDLGTVSPPEAVGKLNLKAGGEIGLFAFLSTIVKLITIGAGLWTVFNVIMAGVKFITAFGETKAYQEARESIQWSVVGLVVIVAAYTIAGLIGLLFFGDASFILNPKLEGAVPL